MSSTMKPANHLGPNDTENLKVFMNANFEEIPNLFGIAQKLMLDHPDEILNVERLNVHLLHGRDLRLFMIK